MVEILTCEERLRLLQDALALVEAGVSSLENLREEERQAISLGRYAPERNVVFERALQNFGTQNTANPLFTGSAASWTLGANWAYNSNNIRHSAGDDATASQVVGDQQISVIDGGLYRVALVIEGYSAGSVRVELGGGSGSGTTGELDSIRANLGKFRSANGTFVEHLYCFGGTSIIIQPTTDFAGDVTQVGVKQIRGMGGSIGRPLAELGNMDWTYAEQIVIAPTQGYDFCKIDVNAAPDQHLNASGSSVPFSVFEIGDVVEITGSDDLDNDGIKTVQDLLPGNAGNTLNFTTDLGGGDVATDTSIQITLRQR